MNKLYYSVYLLVMMCLGINMIGLMMLFIMVELIFLTLLDLKKKLDGDCVSGNKSEREVCAIS